MKVHPVVRDTGISVICLALTVVFDLISLGVTDMNRLRTGPDSVLAVHFDVLLISTSLLLAAYFNSSSAPKKLYVGKWMALSALGFFLCVALVVIGSAEWITALDKTTVSTWIPDLIAFVILAFSVNAAWGIR